MERYERKGTIGGGGFGTALLMEEIATGKLFVAKAMYDDTNNIQKAIEAEKEMIDLCTKVNSPYLVKYFEFVPSNEEEGCSYIIMEYCFGGDLRKVLQDYKSKGEILKYSFLIKVMAECLVGLYVLRLAHMMHRDIKPENIFIIGDDIKIGDFGTKKVLEKTFAPVKTIIGTLDYMAPEVLSGKGYDIRADVYSLGIVFYQLIAGAPTPSTSQAHSHNTSSANPTCPSSPSVKLTESDIGAPAKPLTPGSKGGSGRGSGSHAQTQAQALAERQALIRAASGKTHSMLADLVQAITRTDIPQELKDLIVAMGSISPNERPMLEDILKRPIIRAAVLDLPWSTLPEQLLKDYGVIAANDPKLKAVVSSSSFSSSFTRSPLSPPPLVATVQYTDSAQYTSPSSSYDTVQYTSSSSSYDTVQYTSSSSSYDTVQYTSSSSSTTVQYTSPSFSSSGTAQYTSPPPPAGAPLE